MEFDYQTQQSCVMHFLSLLSVERNLSTNTLKAYECDLNNLITWMQGQNEPSFSAASIFKYFYWLQTTKNLNARSICRKYVSIQQYCEFLVQEKYTDELAVHFSTRRFQLPKSLPRTLRKDEIRNLISATEREYQSLETSYRKKICLRDMCIIELLFCLGLRISEISNILLEDFDNKSQCLLVHGKGKKERILFISSQNVIDKLNEWLKVRADLNPKTPHLFINKYGEKLSVFGIEKIFKKYRSLSHINPEATPHYLRHTFASELLNNGANLRDVQELLGHNSISTTEIYTEISIERKKQVMSQYNERNFLF